MSIEWDGKGLPPFGVECELVNFYGEDFPEFVGEDGEKVKIIGNGFTNSRPVAFYETDGGRGKVIGYAVSQCFRPIRTKAERKRDDAIKVLNFWTGTVKCSEIYDAIAAGKIPGVRLTDD